ncbi:MAG: hypothetical protein EHM13_02600 [Acidobacteria bacterium]|nr:MAG: hypothetical protein EHM13_02600 [Acidobacteriota bacterium]
MAKMTGVWVGIPAIAVVLAFGLRGAAQTTLSTTGHPAVGSYYGLAVQVCPSGVAPSACVDGRPAAALLMTPTLVSDGLFVADDSLALLGAPFGPHTTAHGSWVPTSGTEFSAEYVFMTNPFPPMASGVSASGLRARWQGKVVDADTLVGWVNAYFLNPVPVRWTRLILEEDFPTLPPEAAPFYTAPGGFIKEPSLCRTDGCPQVFKFTLKRIRQ